MFYVYEHWRTDRDECFYVGKGHGRRAYDMKRRNKYHQAIVSKILRTGFAVEIKIVASFKCFFLLIFRIFFSIKVHRNSSPRVPWGTIF